MKHKKNKKLSWLKNHMSPYIGWSDTHSNLEVKKDGQSNYSFLKNKIKEKIILGIKFKWRF